MKRFTCNLVFLAAVLPIAAMAAPVPPYGYAIAQQTLSAGAQATQLNLPQWLQGSWQVTTDKGGRLDVSEHGLKLCLSGESQSLDFTADVEWMKQLGLNILSPQSSANSYQFFVGVNEQDGNKSLVRIFKDNKGVHFRYRPVNPGGAFDMKLDLVKISGSH